MDFLLVVGDTEAWHRQNLSPSYNPSHYSAGRHSSPLPRLLQRLGAGIYYNTDAVVAGVVRRALPPHPQAPCSA